MSSKFQVESNINPYAPPIVRRVAQSLDPKLVADAEQARNEYLTHESAIAAFGWWHIVWGAITLVLLCGDIVFLFIAVLSVDSVIEWSKEMMGMASSLIAGIWNISTGSGLKKLDNNARINATVINGLSFWTGIGILFLVLAWCEKGKMIFTDEYKEVVRLTPSIKRKMTVTAWVLIVAGTLLIFAIAFLFAVLFALVAME